MGSLSGATSTNRRRYACGVGLREDDGCLAFGWFWLVDIGLSENGVNNDPMVNDHYPY